MIYLDIRFWLYEFYMDIAVFGMDSNFRLASTPTPGWEMAAAGRGEHPPHLSHSFPILLDICQPPNPLTQPPYCSIMFGIGR